MLCLWEGEGRNAVYLAGLEFEIGREMERQVLEGWYHSGPAAVVQVFGVKP